MRLPAALTALAIALLPAFAAAQFKWIDAEGRITYGDNPPRDAKNIEPLRRAEPDVDPTLALPLELRRAVANFPLTLYTSPTCSPCTAARELLQVRGAPYTEITLATPQDIEAFRKLDLGDKVPVLMVGRQSVKEFMPAAWHTTLDTAGYPRTSQLPRTWRNPAAKPMVVPAGPATDTATPSAS
jgi:glutaredoxin